MVARFAGDIGQNMDERCLADAAFAIEDNMRALVFQNGNEAHQHVEPSGKAPGNPLIAWGGFLLLLPVYIFGRAFDFLSIEVAAMLGILLAVFYNYFGFRACKHVWFPIFYLGFLIPPPGWLIDLLTAGLKTFVSWAATHLIDWMGYPVARIGVTLYVAQFQLLVEDACSGMNSIVSLTSVNVGNIGSEAIQLISKLSFVAILFFGAKAVIAGALSVGGLVAFNMFARRVSGPVIRMAQLWSEFQQVRVAVERMGDLLNATPEVRPTGGVPMPAVQGHITFENVSFRYADGSPRVVDAIDLNIEPGTMLGIVGSSGSGKSTLTKLLQRLYSPEEGRILVDDLDIAQVDPAHLRRQIGVVLQENVLFSRSVRENIALANPAMRQSDVIAAARMAGAHDFIMQLPQGYDTPIVERGSNLSGGQRQRIAIARALASNPRILVLDEATSALDAESEEIVQHNLQKIATGRTVLIVAHRLSAVRQCDKIIVMEHGRIAEVGSHEALLMIGGRYAELYNRQMGVHNGRKAA